MAAPPAKSSKWGSLLSQAVAGVESRLDNMLADNDGDPRLQGAAARSSTRSPHPVATARPSPVNSPPPPAGRVNDRLQARLAKAMAGKNASATTSPRSSVDQAGRASMERTSVDKEGPEPPQTSDTVAAAAEPDASTPPTSQEIPPMTSAEKPARDPVPNDAVASHAVPDPNDPDTPAQQPPNVESAPQPTDLTDLAKALEEANQRQQEEIQDYVERINSLQSKIQYLSKNAVDGAKQAAASAPSGSLERKLAEKDAKIALLMDEGQKLSGTEQKFRAVIKKLRLQLAEQEKQAEELRKTTQKATSEAESLRCRLDGAQGDEKHQEEARRTVAALQAEVANLKRENTKKDEAYRRLEQEKIETLQSQYASAQENWQGIESSLLAKAASLERERDEAQRRESEMRKKARDAASRCRHLEDELQHAQPALAAARQELEACRDQLTASNASRKAAEEALEQARAEAESEKQRAAHRDDTVEAARRHWVDDVAGATFSGRQSRPSSPLLAVSRAFGSEQMGSPVPGKLRRMPTPAASIPDSPADLMSPLRRLSSQPPARLSVASTVASGPPPSPFSPFESPSEPPPMPSPTAERENRVDDTASSSPRNLAQDMVSASTVAAGPSVQLVERMSAAIRRLEAEKVAAKEEMARMCSQRDEARTDMVGLMKDLEEAKAAASKVPQLHEAMSELDSRYQTTLEMLGEKSELVEELQADVQDVKTMYRELVERTVK